MLKFLLILVFCISLTFQVCPDNCETCDGEGVCSACNSGFILDNVLNECTEEYSWNNLYLFVVCFMVVAFAFLVVMK